MLFPAEGEGKGNELALNGIPCTISRLDLPVWKEEMLNALRSVIRAGADHAVRVILWLGVVDGVVEGESGLEEKTTEGIVVVVVFVTVKTSVTTCGWLSGGRGEACSELID